MRGASLMASQGESGEERESESCQQGGTGLSGGRPGLRRKQEAGSGGAVAQFRSPLSSFLIPWGRRGAGTRSSPWECELPVCQGIAARLLIAGMASRAALASGMKGISAP